MIWTIRWQPLIALAWGPRRATTKRRYGPPPPVYPAYVTASHRLWIKWWVDGVRKRVKGAASIIVVPDTKATHYTPKAPEPKAPVMTDTEAARLMAEREVLRAQKDFAKADEIRDLLRAAGREIQDDKIHQKMRKS